MPSLCVGWTCRTYGFSQDLGTDKDFPRFFKIYETTDLHIIAYGIAAHIIA